MFALNEFVNNWTNDWTTWIATIENLNHKINKKINQTYFFSFYVSYSSIGELQRSLSIGNKVALISKLNKSFFFDEFAIVNKWDNKASSLNVETISNAFTMSPRDQIGRIICLSKQKTKKQKLN